MTLKSADLLAKACEFRGNNLAVADERLDTLVLRGPFASEIEQSIWLNLRRNLPAPFIALGIYNPDISGDLDAEDEFSANQIYIITIEKPKIQGVAYFIFEQGAIDFLQAVDMPHQILIADFANDAAFSARGLAVKKWDLNAHLISPPITDPICPAKLVSDYVPSREIVPDLAPWIGTTPPIQTSRFYKKWQAIAARRLFGGLVSSAWLDDGHVWLQASGPPMFRVRADDPSISNCWLTLTEIANWVYLSGLDIEARHRLFTSELARADRSGQTLIETLKRAWEAADVAYAAHIQSSSRETLKALGDLRKTVIEETQKVSQRAQDLTTGLWKDVAVTSAPFILKLVPDAGKIATLLISGCFYFAAAAFISVSFGLQWRINRAFFDSQKVSRARWFQTLYTYISNRERTEIAEEPIEQALKNYRETRNVLLIVYFFLVVVLIGFGLHDLNERSKLVKEEQPTITDKPSIVSISPKSVDKSPLTSTAPREATKNLLANKDKARAVQSKVPNNAPLR